MNSDTNAGASTYTPTEHNMLYIDTSIKAQYYKAQNAPYAQIAFQVHAGFTTALSNTYY